MRQAMITTALAAALSLALAACGGGAAGTGTATDAQAGSRDPAATAADGATVTIDTEGLGVVSWAREGEEPKFDDDRPYQSAVVNDAAGQTIVIEARDYAEYEGWHFVRWTKDGDDYSADRRIEVLVDGDAAYVAVFDHEG